MQSVGLVSSIVHCLYILGNFPSFLSALASNNAFMAKSTGFSNTAQRNTLLPYNQKELEPKHPIATY